MSHPDKVDLFKNARHAGYKTYLYYICTDSAMINQRRVRNRVSEGGHDVPLDKIRSRYKRSLALLPDAINQAHRAYLFDNSEREHRLVAEFEGGRLVNSWNPAPDWALRALTSAS
jgi:predicted ABC-type ATPase